MCLAGWQVWLTVRLLEQDRNLELQRSRERLASIADLAVAQLAGELADWDIGLRELNALPLSSSLQARFPKGATFILISQNSVKVYPQRPLLFTPVVPVTSTQSPRAFDAADELELREQQFDRAVALLQPMTLESATRPEALLRMARIEYKTGKPEAALTTFKSLAGEASLNPSGTPYALLAAAARCRILKELGMQQEASKEAEALRAGLLEGRWPLSREAFEYQWSALDRLGISVGPPPKSSIDFSTLVGDLYDR